MFELPNAKRVRRDDLLSRNSTSRSPSPAPEGDLSDAHRRLGELLNLDRLLAPTAPEQTRPETNEGLKKEDEDEEQEFEFRLFSAPAPKKPATSSQPTSADGGATSTGTTEKVDGQRGGTQKLRIRLNSPAPGEAGLEEGRFVNPFRGWQYYFTTPELLSGSGADGALSAEALLKKKQFEAAAVTGQQMLGWAQVAWPGCNLPWRVMNLKRHETKLPRGEPGKTPTAAVYIVEPADRVPRSHKKPGKKRRLQLRKRVAAQERAEERAKETEAEKRNRKNRERKLKRRQKARELKAATTAANGQDAPAATEADSGSSSQDEDD